MDALEDLAASAFKVGYPLVKVEELEEQEQEQEQVQVQACPSLNHSPLPRATTMLTQGGEGPEDVLVEWSRPPRNGHSLQHDDRTPLCTIPVVKWSR